MTKVKGGFYYYVVYKYSNKNETGEGTVSVTLKHPIQYQSDIMLVQKIIKMDYEHENVIILNWMQLKGLKRLKTRLINQTCEKGV